MKLEDKQCIAQRRRWRVRRRIEGSAERPRLSLHFSHRHGYAQCIDDIQGRTLVALSTLDKVLREQALKANQAGAKILGEAFGKRAIACGISKVIFDRGERRYHGVLCAFADAAREAGLDF
ncbi:MAG: 50S ribosomal protein L18 [Puniceicoccales bacterium]|jgi:large subunit ribosomal protein L18|nr:50S ribosomal protein L18 [Puniceicoccales bacterium]